MESRASKKKARKKAKKAQKKKKAQEKKKAKAAKAKAKAAKAKKQRRRTTGSMGAMGGGRMGGGRQSQEAAWGAALRAAVGPKPILYMNSCPDWMPEQWPDELDLFSTDYYHPKNATEDILANKHFYQ